MLQSSAIFFFGRIWAQNSTKRIKPNDVRRLENVILAEWFRPAERTAGSGVDETRVLLQESVDFDFASGGEIHTAIYDDGKDETCS
jgi:hypothetical protein